jgi:hypothetical protein
MALYESERDNSRFCQLLIKSLKKKQYHNVTFLVNIADGLAQKSYAECVDSYADEHIHLGLCT